MNGLCRNRAATSRPGTLGLAALLLLSWALPAAASLGTIEQAYELSRRDVQLPGRPEGNLTVRPCSTCKPVLLRVTTATGWFIAPQTRKAVGQPALLAAYKAAAAKPATLVYVYYEPQTRRVNRIVLDVPAAPSAKPVTQARPVTQAKPVTQARPAPQVQGAQR